MVPTQNTKNKTTDKITTNNHNEEPININEEPELIAQDFFLIRLSGFTKTSVKAFANELEAFKKANTTNLIIDLRGNPGGFMGSAIDIASWFLPNNAIVVRERTSPTEHEVVYTTVNHTLFIDGTIPNIVILVDRNSASAAEILAGALQDHKVATIVGEKTFGKGSIQELIDIPGNSSLKVTIARWYTPKGTTISQVGLTPDIIVDRMKNASSSDPILDAGINYLINGEEEE